MARRRRLALRRAMLSFEPPPKVKVFRCLKFMDDDTSEEGLVPESESLPVNAEALIKPSRKRVRNFALWKRNRVKCSRESGRAYVNHRGVYIAAKKPYTDDILCSEKCRYKCSQKFDTGSRKTVFSSFYKLSSDAQNAYLFGCISVSY